MGSVKKAIKKITKISTGGLIGGGDYKGQAVLEQVTPAPEIGTNTETTEVDTSNQETSGTATKKRHRRGKSSLRIDTGVNSSGGRGLNITKEGSCKATQNYVPTEGAKEVYDRLSQDRDNYTQRAEKCATYTIPQLFPKESDDGGTSYETPYNSVGARGLNNLASKLLLSLLPPGQPFFRLGLDQESTQKLNESGDDQLKDTVEYGLSMMEQSIMKYMEAQSLRPTLFECIKQLIIAGNALLFLPPKEGGVKCYTLRDYVVERDGTGNVLQLVARDVLARGSLPEELKALIPDTGDQSINQKVEVYTHVYRESPDSWGSYQEIEGQVVNGSEQHYPLDKSPWIPVRFCKKDNENYGRSFVEDYLGDLISLENLSKSIVDMSMISAKVMFLVSPSCQTNIRALSKAENGAFVRG